MRSYEAALRAFDAKAFWQENKACFQPFSTDKPRVAACFMFEDHFLLNLLAIENTNQYYDDMPYRLACHVRANDILEEALGARFYPEDNIAYMKSEFEVRLGAARVITRGNTPWIEPRVEDVEGIKALIDRVAKMDMRRDAIDPAWYEIREDFRQKTGRRMRFEQGWNGPATIACSVLGTTNLCFYLYDEPEVMRDFFEVVGAQYIAYREAVTLADSGVVDRAGIGINDDSCYIFTPADHARYCVPFQKRFYEAFAPAPAHLRRHHSDSAMQHLIENLGAMGVNEVNIAPDIQATQIRERLPGAVIHGQIHPFLLKNGSPEDIVEKIRHDIRTVGTDGGLVETVVGVIPEGTPLENMRLLLWAVQEYGRYGQ